LECVNDGYGTRAGSIPASVSNFKTSTMTIKQANKILNDKGYNVYIERDRYTKKVRAYQNPYHGGEFHDITNDDMYAIASINKDLDYHNNKVKFLKFNAYCI
jgi:hypothetical protein